MHKGGGFRITYNGRMDGGFFLYLNAENLEDQCDSYFFYIFALGVA